MLNHRVLLIEDNSISQAVVRSALKDVCQIDTAVDGSSALKMLAVSPYDLILLDVNLPDIDGFSLYGKIREAAYGRETPVMFLTALGDIEERVRGFSLGADDYIVKPLQMIEFRARVSAKLRNIEAASKRTPADLFSVGPFHVNLGNQKISVDRDGRAEALELTANQFKVLYYLLRHEGEMVTREDLLKEIWGEKVHVSDRTIDSHVYAIRQQLGPDQKYLRSVHGKGYCLRARPDRETA